jgi:6-pyruvoyltetrahydropterin/6-carboxytetrahydropterin synthase
MPNNSHSLYRVRLEKEDFKFSSAHFTIFPDGNAEPLHGHNYRVTVEVTASTVDELGFVVDFASLKKVIRRECSRLDEMILIPAHCDQLEIRQGPEHCEVDFAQRKYRFPRNEVVLLPITNLTVELLAVVLWQALASELANSRAESLNVGVAETAGQSCFFEQTLGRVSTRSATV